VDASTLAQDQVMALVSVLVCPYRPDKVAAVLYPSVALLVLLVVMSLSVLEKAQLQVVVV
jgi:hypothetical protein